MSRFRVIFLAAAAMAGLTRPACAQMALAADQSPLAMPHTLENVVFAHGIFNQLEGRFGNLNSFRWNGEAWLGTDLDKVWLRSEGKLTNGEVEDGQHELLYSRAISTYFNALVGGRYDLDSLPGRGWGALGIEGLAPQFFRVAATGYVSGDGHFAAKLEGSYDLLITQRLILQPQVELNFYTKDDPMRQNGSGLSDIEAGLRLRYEITRKFAPYIGLAYDGQFGGTTNFARANGSPTDQVRVVAGLRVWF